MADSLYIILLLWTLRCAGSLQVKEESSMLVAFANEIIKATCKVTFAYTKEHSTFNISYFWMNLEGNEITVNKWIVSEKIPKNRLNATVTKVYSLTINPASHNSVSGTYYCKAKWETTTKTGYGTFILFRDKGYEEPLHIMWMLLITFTIALAVLSIMGTALLFWKREASYQTYSYLTPSCCTGY
ncbi:NFAT activation molecule 1 [Elgaria multicarinata webbii]|uniref:NFAT activation molecule 1 n=1 Tax=Elgaria multicarinata webbii TaxID=159646 RepID=UPI002FCD63B7